MDLSKLQIGSKLQGDVFESSKNKVEKKSSEILLKKDHQLVFTYEKRKGKPVTLVGRFDCTDKEKKEVLKLLKKKLACGGAIKEQWLELQGDLKDKIKNILEKEQWKFKK